MKSTHKIIGVFFLRLVKNTLSGIPVRTLADHNYPSGKHTLAWDGTNSAGVQVASGMYFYVLMADNQQVSKKMIYLR